MDRVFLFDFDSRTWSCRMCKNVQPQWTFGHAVKRGRSIFAFGSPAGDAGTLEVRALLPMMSGHNWPCLDEQTGYAWQEQLEHQHFYISAVRPFSPFYQGPCKPFFP